VKILVLSTSLHPASRSRVLAKRVVGALEDAGAETVYIDLRDHPLPLCDGADAYADPNLPGLAAAVKNADAILAASPVYNYDVGSSLKNLLELTGQNWRGKIVGFLLAAGGQGSYMGVMSFASSLMLDFRCLIIPRFVYATGDCFDGDAIASADVEERVVGLAQETVRLATALAD
jgi:NAD(P)H-dependent FMN reductase